MLMVKKVLYIIVFVLLAFHLYWNLQSMTMRVISDEDIASNPYVTIVLDVCCLLFCIVSYNKVTIPYWNRWLVVLLIYVVIVSVFHGLQIGFPRKVAVLAWFQPILIYFVGFHAQQDTKLNRLTPYLVCMMTLFLIALFLFNYIQVNNYTNEEFHTTNSSYAILYFLPLFCLVIKGRYRKLGILAVVVVVLLSSKRGGVLALVLGLIAYYFINMKNQGGFKLGRILRFVFIAFFFVFLFMLIDNYMGGHISNRFSTISEDEGSGRLEGWGVVWLSIKNNSIVEGLFGHGFDTAKEVNPYGFSAHNDYLEVIYDFGWIGLVLELVFLLSTIIHIVTSMKKRSFNVAVLTMALVIFLVNSIFSHIIIATNYLNLFALFFGTFCGIEKYETGRITN